VIEGLSTQLAQLEATIAQQRAIAPTSPNLAGLRAQAQAIRAEIEKRNLEIAGSEGSEAVKLGTYELLMLREQLAANVLRLAQAERDQAWQELQTSTPLRPGYRPAQSAARLRPLSACRLGLARAAGDLPYRVSNPAQSRRLRAGTSLVRLVAPREAAITATSNAQQRLPCRNVRVARGQGAFGTPKNRANSFLAIKACGH